MGEGTHRHCSLFRCPNHAIYDRTPLPRSAVTACPQYQATTSREEGDTSSPTPSRCLPSPLSSLFYSPPPTYYRHLHIYIRWVGVGWKRHCKTCPSLREPDIQSTYSTILFFCRSPQLTVELDHLCGVENIYSARGE